MKVYVALGYEYEVSDIIGIYDTRKGADDRTIEHSHGNGRTYDAYDVEEIEVQEGNNG